MPRARPIACRLPQVCVALLLLGGCERGPDEQALRSRVEESLTRELTPGLLEVTALHRRGCSPLPAADGAGKRIVVYFNATLRFAKDYEFGGWEQLSPSSLAYLLGATAKGVAGVKGQNGAGDLLYVFGTATYEWSGDAWKGVATSTEEGRPAPEVENAAPPSRSKELIDKLSAMVELAPFGVDSKTDEVIAEELRRAEENISQRLARRQHEYTVASGPRGGQYTRFATALVQGLRKAGATVVVRNRETEGSVENGSLLARGGADYALVQSNVAARAFAGEAPFSPGGPLNTLRALGSLFPEPLHIVVPQSSPIREVPELRGKRVDIGTPRSGTRYDAVLILAAHGLRVEDLAEAREGGPEDALRRLRDGRLDAVFATIAAPARSLQDHAARHGLRLLSLAADDIAQLVAQNPGLVPITLPANTYPGQAEDVHTVAAVALLVTTSDVPDGEAERLTEYVFARVEFGSIGSFEGTRTSSKTGLRGITIPLHPGASRYFGVVAGQAPDTKGTP